MYNYIESNASMIRINRGDTYKAPLFINCGTLLEPKRYILQENDKVFFGVMEPNKLWEQSIMRQIYTYDCDKTEEGDIIIQITPEETQYLLPGTYYYMIKLVKYDENNEIDEVTTVVPTTLFVIM